MKEDYKVLSVVDNSAIHLGQLESILNDGYEIHRVDSTSTTEGMMLKSVLIYVLCKLVFEFEDEE